MSQLKSEFAMKNLGPLSYFLGIVFLEILPVFFLSRQKYDIEILEKTGMSQCKPAPTPVTTSRKLSTDAGSPYNNPTLYRSLAGAL